jgi:excisionase family DNA binding protein
MVSTAKGRTPRYLSIQEVAERLGVCDRTIRRAIKSGELRSVLVGSRYRISEEDLHNYLHHRRRI